ncbi:MAG TPA: hypothetical protein VGG25_11535 [Streptosporangiaceae bacterium]
MSRLFRVTAFRAVALAGMAALAAGCIVAGVASASSGSPSPAAASQPAIDHQLCYTAAGTGFKPPPTALLQNQFNTAGFTVKIGAMVVHCNPVKKTLVSGPVYPISNPNAHLACFTISAPTQATFEVTVANQFGTALLSTGQPNMLCLPSWKSLTGPPGMSPNQPPGLSHFTCYPVQRVSGAYNPPGLTLQDEFATAPVSAQVGQVPTELCLPTQKTINGTVYPIVNSTWHLLCFPVSKTPIIPTVWDQNQFGTATVEVEATNSLCVPSTKTISSTSPAP